MRRLTRSEVELIRHLVTGAEPPPTPTRIDWPLVLECAAYHRLSPLLYEAMSDSPVEAPSFVRDRLENAFHVELARSVVRKHHVEALAAAAAHTGRTLCALKGTAFDGWLYVHPASRPMADIDVLARTDDFGPWCEELGRLGFQLHDTSDHASGFRHRDTGVFVELHKSLTSCSGFLGVDTDEVLERSRPHGALRTLSAEDHLIHLALHASFQHGFRQAAINACDAWRLVARPEFDRGLFVDLARSRPATRWIYGGLKLSEQVFPSDRLRALADELEGEVPPRLARRVGRLDAADGLLPEPGVTSGPPFRRVLWAGDAFATLSLLIEVSRPRPAGDTTRAFPWVRRAGQLIWNHCLSVIPSALMKRAHTFPAPTPASLGEVRDV